MTVHIVFIIITISDHFDRRSCEAPPFFDEKRSVNAVNIPENQIFISEMLDCHEKIAKFVRFAEIITKTY